MAEKITVVISGDADQLVSESRRAGAAVTTLGRTVSAQSRGAAAFSSVLSQQQRNLQAMGRWARYAATGVTVLAAGAAAWTVKEGLALNAQWESINASISTFVGGTKEATKFVERLRQVSQKSPLRLTEYAEAARLLMGFGVEAGKTIPLLESMNMAIVATGKGEAEMMQVALALGQIEAKGHASAEELNQLAEVGVPVNKILQRELGLTGEQVANIGEEGVKSEAVLSAIAEGWRKQYGAAYKDSQDTFNFQMAELRKNFEQALRLMSEPLFEELRDEWLPAFNDTAEEIAKIWQRPGITPEQAFEASFRAMGDNLGPLFRRLEREFGELDLGDKAVDAFDDAIPALAEAAARGAGRVAEAFASGFVQSDIWGKLALGAFFIAKSGLGPVIFRRAGTQAASAYAGGMAAGMGASTAVPVGGGLAMQGLGAGGRLRSLGAGALRFGAYGAGIGGVIGAVADPSGEGLGGRIQNAISGATFGLAPSVSEDQQKELAAYTAEVEDMAGALEEGGMAGKAAAESLRQMREVIAVLPGLTDEQRDAMLSMTRTTLRGHHEMNEAVKESAQESENFANTWGLSLDEIAKRTSQNMKRIERDMGKGSAEGRRAIAENFGAAIEAIRNSMDSGEIAVKKGNAAIQRLLERQLRAYGVTDPKGFLNRSESVQRSGSEGHRGLRRGGALSGGTPSGDSIEILGERGEYMLNRNAVAAMGGKAVLDQINFRLAPRGMQQGGIVGLGNQLLRQGYEVGEHPAFGGVAPVHTPGSYHYRGMAIDVNDDSPPFGSGSGEPGSLDRLHSRLKGMPGVLELLWRTAGHFDHLHVAMAAGAAAALGGMGGAPIKLPRFSSPFRGGQPHARGLNQFSAGMEREFTKALGAMEGAEPGISAGGAGSWQAALREIAKSRGWSVADWMELVMRESGGNPEAVNPSSGAFGLGQFLGATARNYARYGALSHDPVRQIEAMARYIADRYDTPSAALAFHDAHNWYAKGGMVHHATSRIRRLRGHSSELERRLAHADPEDRRSLRRRLARSEYKLGAAEQFRAAAREMRHGRRTRRALNHSIDPIIGDFMADLGLPYLGAFAKGGLIHRDGLARVHEGERVVPAHVERASGPVQVKVVVAGNHGEMVRIVGAEVDGRKAEIVREVDRTLGREGRQRSFAPGGRG